MLRKPFTTGLKCRIEFRLGLPIVAQQLTNLLARQLKYRPVILLKKEMSDVFIDGRVPTRRHHPLLGHGSYIPIKIDFAPFQLARPNGILFNMKRMLILIILEFTHQKLLTIQFYPIVTEGKTAGSTNTSTSQLDAI
jgi:hypothetical protein